MLSLNEKDNSCTLYFYISSKSAVKIDKNLNAFLFIIYSHSMLFFSRCIVQMFKIIYHILYIIKNIFDIQNNTFYPVFKINGFWVILKRLFLQINYVKNSLHLGEKKDEVIHNLNQFCFNRNKSKISKGFYIPYIRIF